MTKQNYLAEIRQTEEARQLNGLHHDAMNDPSLHSTDKDEIATAVQNKFASMNAAAMKEVKPRWNARAKAKTWGPVLSLIFFIFAVLVPPTANGQAAVDALLSRRLAALSMIESGDDDKAIGKAGEVSRYQIKPSVWHAYMLHDRPDADPRNPLTARNVATMILHDRCQAFAARFHRQPTDLEFYLLWNSPAALDGAERFSNLVSSSHKL